MSESVPLLRSSSVTSRRRCPSYRFQFIHSKGALLVLFWDLMISISQNLVIDCAAGSFVDFYFIIAPGFCLIYFIAGYFGDFLVSRYKLVLVGSLVTFIVLIPFIIIFILLPSYKYLLLVLCTLILVTFAIVRVNLLPFNIDQLIGSSSHELTAVLHWHNIGTIIEIAFASYDVKVLHLLVASIVCVSAVLVSHSLFNHYLDTTPVNTVNPVKLIVRVLCYARKHKYPENRSALTYWEEEAPSRLDLGKDKYGGPFTEEEVEDVKTVLRLIPLVIACAVTSGLLEEYTEGLTFEVYGCKDSDNIDLSFSVSYVFIILLHQFLIYPCFHKYIPSMLKRIGLGLVLIVLVNILYTGLAVIGNYHFGQAFRCFTVYDDESPSASMTLEWIIIIDITHAVLWYVFNVVLVEFILAQCPKSMRGTMIGLLFCFWGSREFVDYTLFLPFLHSMSPEVLLGRGFYFLLAKTIVCSIILLIYIFLAKRYKLRVREVEINIHQIAENHIINNIEREEEYRKRNSALEFSTQSTDTI